MQNYECVCMWACGGEGGKKVHKLLLDYQSKWLKQIVKLSENEREIRITSLSGNPSCISILKKADIIQWKVRKTVTAKTIYHWKWLSYKLGKGERPIFSCWYWNKHIKQNALLKNFALMSWKDHNHNIKSWRSKK